MRVEGDGAVVRVVLDAPERLNALDLQTLIDVRVAIERAAADEQVRAVVLTGEGRAFCAGANLTFIGEADTVMDAAGRLITTITTADVPVLAAVNGPAVGYGAALVAACDLAKEGKVAGIVTPPLNKAAMHLGGHKYPGHTELLAEQFGVEDFSLVLSAGDLYFFHLTTHVSMREAIELITPERTTAVLEGDQWRVNGQKVWTSSAREATYGLLIARTNPDVPKHRGLTFFVIPMKQDGVDVRPLVQITGDAHFNEVFLTDAWVDDANRLGEVNAGWLSLMTALGYERLVMGARGVGSRASDPRYVGTADDLISLARDHGKLDDSATVQRLADVYAERAAARLNAARYAAEGRGQDAAAMSLGKLMMSRILHGTAGLRRDIIGADVLYDDRTDPPGTAEVANFFTLDAYFTSIGGGTDQVQRNILAERMLGLRKETDASKDIPFKDVRQ